MAIEAGTRAVIHTQGDGYLQQRLATVRLITIDVAQPVLLQHATMEFKDQAEDVADVCHTQTIRLPDLRLQSIDGRVQLLLWSLWELTSS